MKKIGILTFHYSNNYGGVLQSYSLFMYLKSMNLNVEIINFIPSKYKNDSIFRSTGLRKNIFKSKKEDLNPTVLTKRIMLKARYNKNIINRFDNFRNENVKLSKRVDEETIVSILNEYETIIVGSDQVWNPGRRDSREYFLGFEEKYKGKKISYAADSTISAIDQTHKEKLRIELMDFDAISVRNEHTNKFVKDLTGNSSPVVVDPTLLYNIQDFSGNNYSQFLNKDKYILVYALGKEINGTHVKVLRKIKENYGDLKVYSIIIPTMKFNICNYADKVFYDLGPKEWVNLIKNASFVYTDSYHGTIFSLKFHIPFLAYYAEEMRSTRFLDLGKRYKIDRYIINGIDEIDRKQSLGKIPDFEEIDKLIEVHRETSVRFLQNIFCE